MYALPLLSSFLDVTGQLMLVAAFAIARHVAGAPPEVLGDEDPPLKALLGMY